MTPQPNGLQWAECPECGAIHWMPVYNARPTKTGGWAFDFKEHDLWCEQCRELLHWDREPDGTGELAVHGGTK